MYDELVEISDEIINKYEEFRRKQYEELAEKNKNENERNKYKYRYRHCNPRKTNFNKNDYVINVMGINPSVPLNEREKDYDEKNEHNNEYIDLYYIPHFDNDLKYKAFVLGSNFSRKQYSFLCEQGNKEDIFDGKYLKMHWQKFDDDYIKKTYGNCAKEYIELIHEINDKYKETGLDKNFLNIYLNYSELVYISHYDQNPVVDFLEKYNEDVKKLFEKQLEYYNSTITIIANSGASKIVENYIFNDTSEWTMANKIYSELSKNIYIREKDKKIVYLFSRFHDGRQTNEYAGRLFKEDFKKLINRCRKEGIIKEV